MNAAPLITSGTGQFKAVCHKCQYVGFEPNCTKCPVCDFPMLLEPYESARLTLRDIFDRSTIEFEGRPGPSILPGVNRTERQRKEMLARAQRRLSTTHEVPEPTLPQLVDRTQPIPQPTPVHGTLHHQVAPAVSSSEPMAPGGLVSSLALAATSVQIGPSYEEAPGRPTTIAPQGTMVRTRSFMPLALAFVTAIAAVMAMVAATGGF